MMTEFIFFGGVNYPSNVFAFSNIIIYNILSIVRNVFLFVSVNRGKNKYGKYQLA